MPIDIPTSIGNSRAQQRFISHHQEFLQEFPALQSLINESLRLSTDRVFPEPETEETDADPTDEQLAERVVFWLERAALDDFAELVLQAANGMGIGATKTLRSIYERLVTAMFIAKHPVEARIFIAHADVERGKVLSRALAAAPDLVNKDFTPEQIQKIQDQKKATDAQRKTEYCGECNQPKTAEAWTRVSLDSMAKKVDEQMLNLYGVCYLSPTLLTHATSFGLDLRFRTTLARPDDTAISEGYAHSAVWRGHLLILRLLQHQDSYFNLGIGPKIDLRCSAFSTIWRDDLASA